MTMVMNEIDIGRGVPTELEDLEHQVHHQLKMPISNEAQIQECKYSLMMKSLRWITSGNDGNTSVVAADSANKCDTTDAITSGAKNTLDKVADKTVGESADKAESEPEDETEHETDDETDSEDDDSTTDPDYEPFDDIETEADQGEDDVDHVPGDVYKGRKFLCTRTNF
ncbi:ribosomal L1 domain-containing protein CG13096-like [Anneissia japonica]|uniref:ribosomal L1 domain-containing protein CG13096-like n=1 Tax=Anneissia japonica TaxID=1529436 RepID=UPI001425820A|nr:ribosomal L1 domain-containing protein CG13096-like [Anneissia japonica]